MQTFPISNINHYEWSPQNALFPSMFLLFVKDRIINLLEVLDVIQKQLI